MDKGKYFRIERTLESLGFTSFYDYRVIFLKINVAYISSIVRQSGWRC